MISDFEKSASDSSSLGTSLSDEIRDGVSIQAPLGDPVPDCVSEGTATANKTFTVSCWLLKDFMMAAH